MIAILKKFAYEFSIYLFFSLLLEIFGLKDITNLVGSIVLMSLFRKFMPYKKGEDFELDERVRANSEKAGLMTLAYLTVLFGIIYFVLKYTNNLYSNYVLFLILSIYIAYLCILAICMRRS